MMRVQQQAVVRQDRIAAQDPDHECIEEGQAVLECLEVNDINRAKCKDVLSNFYACAEGSTGGYQTDSTILRLNQIWMSLNRR
jgi:hypothetical protein